jgi:hypothetical protein
MPAPNYFERNVPVVSSVTTAQGNDSASTDKPYYNPRLDSQNYLQGPLSDNAATRLRQMIARPGIVVSDDDQETILPTLMSVTRLPLVFAMALARAALWRLVSSVSIRGGF